MLSGSEINHRKITLSHLKTLSNGIWEVCQETHAGKFHLASSSPLSRSKVHEPVSSTTFVTLHSPSVLCTLWVPNKMIHQPRGQLIWSSYTYMLVFNHSFSLGFGITGRQNEGTYPSPEQRSRQDQM